MKKINVTKEQYTTILLLLMIFVFGGVFGFIYEELFYRIDLGHFVKRGTTLGPWIPIYGFGAVSIVLATERLKKNPFLVFLTAAAVSGIIEFATGYLLLHSLEIRLWDYNVEIWNWCNVGGYVCLRSILFFGISALFLQYIVQPVLLELCRKSEKVVSGITGTMAVLFTIDILGALVRLLKIR